MRGAIDISASAHQRIVMRTTLTVDDDVFEAAKVLAASSGKNLGEVVSELARRGLRAEVRSGRKSNLPVFRVSPDAPVIPSSRAQKMLADDRT